MPGAGWNLTARWAAVTLAGRRLWKMPATGRSGTVGATIRCIAPVATTLAKGNIAIHVSTWRIAAQPMRGRFRMRPWLKSGCGPRFLIAVRAFLGLALANSSNALGQRHFQLFSSLLGVIKFRQGDPRQAFADRAFNHPHVGFLIRRNQRKRIAGG